MNHPAPTSQLNEVFAPLHRPDRSGRPKYLRLASVLMDGMRKGVWRPGDRLPPEEELTALTPFSLGTIQRALRDLADQGLVLRQHGLGSFVADRPRQLQDPWHCRFLDDDGVTVLPIFSQAIARVAEAGDGPWRKSLGYEAEVMRLDRVIVVNDEFRIFSRFYADRKLLGKMWEMPMTELHGANFRQLIVNECQLPITEITRLITISQFDDEACEYIGAPGGCSGIHLQATAQAGRLLAIYYQDFFIPPTRHPLQVPENSSIAD